MMRRGLLLLLSAVLAAACSGPILANSPAPTGAPYEKPTPDHLRQLALYRAAVVPMYAGKKIRCYLIFTRTAAIIEANDADLDAAQAVDKG